MFETNSENKINVIKQNGSSDMKLAVLGISRIVRSIFENPGKSKLQDSNLVGFINIDPIDSTIDLSKLPKLLGEMKDFESIIRKYGIKKLLVALEPADIQIPKLKEIIQFCESENVDYEFLNNAISNHRTVYNTTGNNQPAYQTTFTTIGSDTSSLNGNPAVGIPDANLYEKEKLSFKYRVGELMKKDPPPKEFFLQRLIDLFASILMFLLFLPSWIVVAIAIRLESKGGVLYTQERVGEGGRIFKIYKFRSMFSDAEKRSGPTLATHNDPRITRVGGILRRTRIDELPQLVNVIKGDMSLIGPRPERPYFVEKYDKEIPRYLERLKVKPGLTGFAQVETGYDESLEDVKIKVEYDLYYIAHRDSFKLYFKIMLKTLWVVLTAKGQ